MEARVEMARRERQERATAARMRSNLYGLLATVFRQEVTPDLLQTIRGPQISEVLSDLGIDLFGGLSTNPEEERLEALAVEYARLFLGPSRHISPHESVHHQREDGQWGQLWADSTVEVKRFIETAGFRYDSEFTGMPDHISVELEFMEQVTQREEQAWSEDDKEAPLYCQKIEKKFMEEHLLKWIPGFCDKVAQEAELPFYRDMAVMTKHFMVFEREELNGRGNPSMDLASADVAGES